MGIQLADGCTALSFFTQTSHNYANVVRVLFD